MKKVLYFILLAAELALGAVCMNIIWNATLQLPCVIVAIVCAALLVWQVIKLVKATDDAAKRKAKRNIALVLLIPTIVFVVLVIWFIVAMSMGY